MSRLRRLLAAGSVSAALLLGGCGEPGPSDGEASLSAMQEQSYQDAFDIYAKYAELYYAIEQQGGVEVLPDEIKEYVTGPQLALIDEVLTTMWSQGWYNAGVNVHRIEGWQRGADPEPDNTDWYISVEVCGYHEYTDLLDGEGNVRGAGDTIFEVAYVQFARDQENNFKVYNISWEVVESCPF